MQLLEAMDIAKKVAKAKAKALQDLEGPVRRRPLYQQIFPILTGRLRNYFLLTFVPCLIYDRNRDRKVRPEPRTLFDRFFYDGSYENEVIKSIMGFVSGLLVSTLWLFLMVYYMSYELLTAIITCSIMSFVLSIGLGFSANVRCLTMLALPQLFSSKGRAVLLAMCFVLTLNGPVRNFKYNVQVMTGTLTCGQQMAGNLTKELVNSALSPVQDIIDILRSVLKAMQRLSQDLRVAVLKVKALFAEILAAIKRLGDWMGDLVTVCNKRMGAPNQRCRNGFAQAAADCRIRLWKAFSFLCHFADWASVICNVFKIIMFLCSWPEMVRKHVTEAVSGAIDFSLKKVYDMFYFKVNLTYEYDLQVEQSKSFTEIRYDIQTEIEQRIRPLIYVASISNVGLCLMLLLLFFKAYRYRKKYRSDDRFDNYFITWHIQDIQERREEQGKETILPLNWKEMQRYVKTTQSALAKHEFRRLMVGLAFLGMSGLHIFFQIAIDYGLHWLLKVIQQHGEIKTRVIAPGRVKMHVQGEGVLADMYRSLVSMLDPATHTTPYIDTTPCLPIPSEPNYDTYMKICYIYATCILLQLVQSYGLRMRHVVAGCYYPEREKLRAVWLYNHILKRRGSFITVIRRNLHLAVDESEEKHTMLSLLAAKSPFLGKILRKLGCINSIACITCGKTGKPSDQDDFIHCDNETCKAVYCKPCYVELNNMCTACCRPVNYAIMADFSEEVDSSDSAEDRKRNKKLNQAHRKMFGEDLHFAPSKSLTSSSSSSSSSSSTTDSEDYEYQKKKNLDVVQVFEDDVPPVHSQRKRRTEPLERVSVLIFDDDSSEQTSGQEEESKVITDGQAKPIDMGWMRNVEDQSKQEPQPSMSQKRIHTLEEDLKKREDDQSNKEAVPFLHQKMHTLDENLKKIKDGQAHKKAVPFLHQKRMRSLEEEIKDAIGSQTKEKRLPLSPVMSHSTEGTLEVMLRQKIEGQTIPRPSATGSLKGTDSPGAGWLKKGGGQIKGEPRPSAPQEREQDAVREILRKGIEGQTEQRPPLPTMPQWTGRTQGEGSRKDDSGKAKWKLPFQKK